MDKRRRIEEQLEKIDERLANAEALEGPSWLCQLIHSLNRLYPSTSPIR